MDQLLRIRNYKKWGFQLQYWLIDATKWGGKTIEMVKSFTLPEGYYIGDSKWAYRICVKRGIKPRPIELPKPQLPHNEAKELLLNGESDSGPICSIGYNKKQHKWYGWSHRAICGFSIGSKVKKGHCAYNAPTPKEMLEDLINFFGGNDENHRVIFANEKMKFGDTNQYRQYQMHSHALKNGGNKRSTSISPNFPERNTFGVYIKIETTKKDGSGMIIEHFEPYPFKWGRGEWTAKTMDDAMQMAIAFAQGVA
jgi:hypothetical protein